PQVPPLKKYFLWTVPITHLYFHKKPWTKLCLSDEPAAGLDPVFRKDFFKLLQEFVSEYQATILVSDNIEENLDQIADFIITIENGKS
ncbi:hypothetical protein ACKUFN_26705, partial [Escherichia coli]